MQASYLGRQPILDVDEATFGYELLFRSAETNSYDPSVDGDRATAQVLIGSVVELGLERLVGDSLGFINLTDCFLENPDLVSCLPPERVVLEVLETVRPTPAVIEGIATLKKRGYTIALDDFVDAHDLQALVMLADIIKYDITHYDMATLARQVTIDRAGRRRVLAERVETPEEFQQLKAMGFDYFQGFHFARPLVVKGATIASNRISLLQLLALVNDPSASNEDLVEAVSRDVSLSVRALRFCNSPATGLRREVTSIHQAISLLGRATLRNWITLLMMSHCDGKPDELTTMALVRARYCQLLCQSESCGDPSEYFTLGLLSLLNVLMDSTMESVLESICATTEFHAVLLHGEGRAGEMLRTVRFLETGHDLQARLGKLDITPAMLEAFQSALMWAEDIRRSLPTD